MFFNIDKFQAALTSVKVKEIDKGSWAAAGMILGHGLTQYEELHIIDDKDLKALFVVLMKKGYGEFYHNYLRGQDEKD